MCGTQYPTRSDAGSRNVTPSSQPDHNVLPGEGNSMMSVRMPRSVRTVAVGTLLYAKHMSRSPLELVFATALPVVQATLAFYLFQTSSQPHRMVEASVGAGLMGVWTYVLFGAGGAIQLQRIQGTLESLMLAPRSPVLVVLPLSLANTVVGSYAMFATIGWGVLLFGVRPNFANPVAFLIATPVCVIALGMLGLLLASTFILLRNANALTNALEYPIWLLSGMLVPVTVLPSWTGPLAAILPTTWGARAVQESVTGGPVWPALGICLAEGIACLVLGAIALTYVDYRARATATLALA
jgi:ABC-2 type transport system permease protein